MEQAINLTIKVGLDGSHKAYSGVQTSRTVAQICGILERDLGIPVQEIMLYNESGTQLSSSDTLLQALRDVEKSELNHSQKQTGEDIGISNTGLRSGKLNLASHKEGLNNELVSYKTVLTLPDPYLGAVFVLEQTPQLSRHKKQRNFEAGIFAK